MIKTSVVVRSDRGFDGRPIALLVQEASQYASKVYIQSAGRNNIKSSAARSFWKGMWKTILLREVTSQ